MNFKKVFNATYVFTWVLKCNSKMPITIVPKALANVNSIIFPNESEGVSQALMQMIHGVIWGESKFWYLIFTRDSFFNFSRYSDLEGLDFSSGILIEKLHCQRIFNFKEYSIWHCSLWIRADWSNQDWSKLFHNFWQLTNDQ